MNKCIHDFRMMEAGETFEAMDNMDVMDTASRDTLRRASQEDLPAVDEGPVIRRGGPMDENDQGFKRGGP